LGLTIVIFLVSLPLVQVIAFCRVSNSVPLVVGIARENAIKTVTNLIRFIGFA